MWRPIRPSDPAARAARLVTIAATVVFALIVLRWRPWDLLAREAYSNDFYDEQARSFLRLRLHVRPEVPLQEGFLVDGRTYLYYGPFLAWVRMPFALFGELFVGRLARLSMIAGFVTALTASYHLVRRFTASPWRVAGFVAATACSPLLFLAGWVSVYHETELWAAAFALWAIVGVVRLTETGSPTRRDLALVAVALFAGITTRASVGIGIAVGACAAVALCTAPLRSRSSPDPATTPGGPPRRSWLALGVTLGASAVGFAAHAGINAAKFGSPTALPGQLQVLSLNDPTRAAWFAGNGDSFFSPRFLETTVVQYLRPDTVRPERMFPFLRYGPLATDRGSYPMETITPSASLTTSATLLVVAALIGLVLVVRARRWDLVALTAGGALAAVPTYTIGFIGNRYLVDMLPMLLVPAAFAFGTFVSPAPSPAWRRAARLGTVVLVAWGAWCNVALALWTQQLKEPGFTEWRYRVDDWFFGNPAPALVDLVAGAPVPRDGVVVLDRDPAAGTCSAVYIAEQGALVALERSNDGRRLAGSVTLTGERTLVAAGDDWAVTAVAGTDGVRLEAVVDPTPDGVGGAQVVGAPIAAPAGSAGAASSGTPPASAVPASAVLAFEVIADPVTGQLSARLGHHALDDASEVFVFAAPQGAAVPGATATVDDDPGDSLCRQLEARR
jgi:hypothetical protein